MELTLELKQQLYKDILASVEVKIAEVDRLMLETSESMKNDTKSSAGDKFETGREMLQAELNNKQIQLNKLLQTKKDLSKMNLLEHHVKVGFGSLVQTSIGCYYISVALGAITLNGEKYYALSLASPVGKLLSGREVGDKYTFQSKNVEILQIV